MIGIGWRNGMDSCLVNHTMSTLREFSFVLMDWIAQHMPHLDYVTQCSYLVTTHMCSHGVLSTTFVNQVNDFAE